MSAFQRKLLRTVIRSNNFQRLDAINGIEVSAARSVGYTKFRRGLIVSSSLTDVATVTRSTTRLAQGQSGAWAEYAAGAPALNKGGLDVWEGTTNKCTGYNAAPPALITPAALATFNAAAAGIVATNGDGATLFGVVDDTTELRNAGFGPLIDAGRMNGRVYKIDNTAGAVTAFLFAAGNFGNTNSQTTSAFVRGGSLAGVGDSSNGGRATLGGSGSATYRRLIASNFIPALSTDRLVLRCGVGQVAYFALFQSEEKPYATPPVIVAGAAATRNPDVITEAVNIPVGQAFTVLWKGIAPVAAPNFSRLAVLADSVPTPTNALTLYFNPSVTAVFLGMLSAGVNTANPNKGCTPGAPLGVSLAVNGNQVAWSVNGSAVSTHTMTGGALSGLLAILGEGVDPFEGGRQLNSTIRDLNIAMRAYSAAELQAASDVSLTHDIDFTAQSYKYVGDPYTSVTDLPMTTFTRATTGFGVTAAGALTSFASGVPRITDAGLTVEAAATNLLLRSQEIDHAAWGHVMGGTGTLPVVTDNFAAAPDGTLTASRIQAAQGAGGSEYDFSLVYQAPSAASFQYTKSIWLKSNTGSPQNVVLYDSHAQAGTVCSVTTSWQRFSITGIATVSPQLIVGTRGGSGQFFNGGDPTIDVLAWGGQIEAGTVATSYIPTTTVPVTRNADVLASADTVISPTIVAEFTTPSLTNYRTIFAHIGTSSTDAVLIYSNGAQIIARVNVGGIAQAVLTLGSIVPNTVYKVAFRVVANDFAASLNGAVCVVDGAGTLPTVTTAYIGVENSSVNPWGAGIRKIKRYSTAKTNAELQVLATL